MHQAFTKKRQHFVLLLHELALGGRVFLTRAYHEWSHRAPRGQYPMGKKTTLLSSCENPSVKKWMVSIRISQEARVLNFNRRT